jgi:hypothetical protein
MAIWISLSLSEPALLHTCPVHDVTHAAGAGASGAAHHAPPSNEARHTTPVRGHASHRGCTCLGDCCAAGPVGIASPTLALATSLVLESDGAALPEHAYVPVAAQHVLPFQNGPPAAG